MAIDKIRSGRKLLTKHRVVKIKDEFNPYKHKMVDHPLAATDPRYKGAKVKVNKI